MFKNRTLFVIGAGASDEAGLPIGSALAEKIANTLRFEFSEFGDWGSSDARLYRFMQEATANKTNGMRVFRQAAAEISEAIHMSKSIDDYIDTFKHDETIGILGKACIVYEILKAERGSK